MLYFIFWQEKGFVWDFRVLWAYFRVFSEILIAQQFQNSICPM